MKQNRWKSKAMWIGIISGLFIVYNSIANEFGLPSIDDGTTETILNLIAGAFTVFATINNPTSKDSL